VAEPPLAVSAGPVIARKVEHYGGSQNYVAEPPLAVSAGSVIAREVEHYGGKSKLGGWAFTGSKCGACYCQESRTLWGETKLRESLDR
jgi:hypothetical protein